MASIPQVSGEFGIAQQPVVIRGSDDQSAVFMARRCCNATQLDATSYVEVRKLTLDPSIALRTPFDDLDFVDASINPCKRHILDGDAPRA